MLVSVFVFNKADRFMGNAGTETLVFAANIPTTLVTQGMNQEKEANEPKLSSYSNFRFCLFLCL
jgi:hypothetical protein